MAVRWMGTVRSVALSKPALFCLCVAWSNSGHAEMLEQAKTQATQFFEKLTTKCTEDDYLFGIRSAVADVKEMSFSIKELPTTEINRMNGLDWRGIVKLAGRGYRQRINQQWSQWMDVSQFTLSGEIQFNKGQWRINWDGGEYVGPMASANFSKLSCDILK